MVWSTAVMRMSNAPQTYGLVALNAFVDLSGIVLRCLVSRSCVFGPKNDPYWLKSGVFGLVSTCGL